MNPFQSKLRRWRGSDARQHPDGDARKTSDGEVPVPGEL